MRKLAIFMILILCVTFAIAHSSNEDDYVFKEKISDTKYYPRENRAVTTTTYIDYDNEKRFSTYDYRHGYTYRATTEYRDSYKVYRDDYNVRHSDRDYSRYYEEDDNKIYYYEKSPYSNRLIEKSCYNSRPSNKLFYIKC